MIFNLRIVVIWDWGEFISIVLLCIMVFFGWFLIWYNNWFIFGRISCMLLLVVVRVFVFSLLIIMCIVNSYIVNVCLEVVLWG